MADEKISDLAETTTLIGGDYLAATHSAATKKVSVTNLLSYARDGFTEVVKTVDEVITNSSTATNSAELFFAVTGPAIYKVEFNIIYSGNNPANDFKWELGVIGQQLLDAAQWIGRFSAPNTGLAATETIAIGGNAGGSSFWPFGSSSLGTDATSANSLMPLNGDCQLYVAGAATLYFRFCSVSAGVGRTATLRAGSVLRYKRLF